MELLTLVSVCVSVGGELPMAIHDGVVRWKDRKQRGWWCMSKIKIDVISVFLWICTYLYYYILALRRHHPQQILKGVKCDSLWLMCGVLTGRCILINYQVTLQLFIIFLLLYPVRGCEGGWSLSQQYRVTAEYTMDKSPVHHRADK